MPRRGARGRGGGGGSGAVSSSTGGAGDASLASSKSTKSGGGGVVTVSAMAQDSITSTAMSYWAPFTSNHRPFDSDLIVSIYTNEILGTMFAPKKIVMLEFSQYLEAYLWPNFHPDRATTAHMMSIIVMVNEKFRERIPAWGCFVNAPGHFAAFFQRVLQMSLNEVPKKEQPLGHIEHTAIIAFLVNCINSVEIDIVRSQTSRLVSLPIWINLLPAQREDLFETHPKLGGYWTKMMKKDAEMDATQRAKAHFDRSYLWNLLNRFKTVLDEITPDAEPDIYAIRYCERFLEFVIDLEALLPTRRFFNAILGACHLVTHCTLSHLIQMEEGGLFCQLVQMVRFYSRFEIDDVTGQQLTQGQMTDRHYQHVVALQKAAFKYFRESMPDFYLLSVSSVDTRKALIKLFNNMNKDDLYKFAEFLHLVPSMVDDPSAMERFSQAFLTETITSHCERRPNQLQQLNDQPLYPTEQTMWDENLVPYEQYNGDGVLALNKLNLQFLTLHDYLLRNFNLFQMESTYPSKLNYVCEEYCDYGIHFRNEIRQDLEDAILRMKPWAHESGNPADVVWGGWARMALPISTFQIVEVAKPLIGEKSPASVRADVMINIAKRADLRREWENLRKHDICFLVACRPTKLVGTPYDMRVPFKEQFEIAYVRGCEIEGMLDPQGRVIEEFSAENLKPLVAGDVRTYRVWLDTNQYRIDMEKHWAGGEDPYNTLNLIVRRDSKSNNFKAVLATMRQLLNTECVVPDWLHDLILGFGEPDEAHYAKMNNSIATMDFNDTFLTYKHVVDSFPDQRVIATTTEKEKLVPPFRLTFKELEPQHDLPAEKRDRSILVQPHIRPNRGPYPYCEPKRNTVLFTPAQVEAIKSGMEPGLTMVVGPPGTGKTDVAVQIVSNIYHNWPEQRTLIVTHSNQALNQLFEKIMALDIDERHLLRLGHGEEALETEKDFSRYGRVNYVLAKRLDLLKEVERLQLAIDVAGDVAYTCETAGHFFLYQVYARWETFLARTAKTAANPNPPVESVRENFPFIKYFDDAPPPLFKGVSYDEDWDIAQGCWRHLKRIFDQLEEFRAFELLRTGRDRTEYLLVKEAKIIAMTCTHAALRRKDLVELGFRYDNILMEEAAQILEVETFIPLLLQNPQDGRNRLKRWIMIGDHHQLPPVVQNMAYQKYSNMEQSLFARFVRLGVPTILLDRQGRARAEIATLYNWRYRSLGNLPHVEAREEFQTANAGFVFNYQLVDVPDFNGIGESTPSAFFYQNLGEAEYAVALYSYMRILGYPAERISLITTYNGQAGLLRDVVERRCAGNPLFGRPGKISTVDKYQGQQNDYVILSLVRTKTIGHIRDVRRLIVALSRARLGLFVLGRASIYRNCFELTPAFNILCKRPTKLLIVPNEQFPTQRRIGDKPPMEPMEIQDTAHMCAFVNEFYMRNMQTMQADYEYRMRDVYRAKQEAITAELAAQAAALQAATAHIKVVEPPKPPDADDAVEKEITFEAMEEE